jgi:hypothetical protein
MKMRPLGGFSRVIPVYHRVNQTCESQEADQRPQSMKKPPKHFCLSGFLPSMDTPEGAAPEGAERAWPNKCIITRANCQARRTRKPAAGQGRGYSPAEGQP